MARKHTMIGITILLLLSAIPMTAAAADKTTKYRVYQDNALLMETADYKKAETYAKQFTSSHVEDIATRAWLWHNYPRYKVYQNDRSQPAWEFATLDQAIREASNWTHASVRDLQGGGWVWNNYPRYRLYQGDQTLDSWEFATLAQATAEARKWSNAHIIDLNNHEWVWDNIAAAEKQQLRDSNQPVYQVYQGTATSDSWKFSYLEDAVAESLHWSNSTVINLERGGMTVFSNIKPYKVYQFDTELEQFLSMDEAILYAQQWAHSKIVNTEAYADSDSIGVWNNYPYYQVLQNKSLIGDSSNIAGALQYAMQYANASIRTLDGATIWDNFRKLQFWGWNGSSSDTTVRGHVANTSGLDVVSPTYFQLADAAGGLTDTSNKDTVAFLKRQGYTVYPLVANQFNSSLTTQFLANKGAQTKFIQALVRRLTELGADGINVDFESLNGKDRAAFMTFIQNLSDAAHKQGLIVSIDLPRGSVKWNAQTAFDHEKLPEIVDYIVTMTYDQHWSGSTTPGPVAGLQWVEEGIQEFLSYGIPRDKLIMGIPLYTREWKVDTNGALVSNRSLLYKDLPTVISSKKAKLTWDDRFGQYRADYTEDGNNYVFWLENEQMVDERLAIAKKYDLGGVAFWRLGYDPADLWNTMVTGK
jgi:spore germination protein YaaH